MKCMLCKGKIYQLIMLCISVVGLLSACSSKQSDHSNMVDVINELPATEENTVNTSTLEPEEHMDGDEELEREREAMEKWLNQEDNYFFIGQTYDSPLDIDWNIVMSKGAGQGNEVTGEEAEAYCELLGLSYRESSIYKKISIEELSAFAEEKTAVSYAEAKYPLSKGYLEEQDAYFFLCDDSQEDLSYIYGSGSTSEPEHRWVCDEIIQNGNQYIVKVGSVYSSESDHSGHAFRHEVVLENNEEKDSFYYVSNHGIVEDDANYVKEIVLNGFENAVTFVAYPKEYDECTILFMQNGEIVSSSFAFWEWNDRGYPAVNIIDVGILDYNLDGLDDMIIIGEADGQRYAEVKEGEISSYDSRYILGTDSFLSERVNEELEELTVDSITELLMNGHTGLAFNSWQDAYSYLLRLYPHEDYYYDLIYVDKDSIPELVMDDYGYYISLYTYTEEGRVVRVMDQWPYGAWGNIGYQYLPHGNRIYNRDSDQGGAIVWHSFMTMDENYQIVDDYYIYAEYDYEKEPVYLLNNETELSEEEFSAYLNDVENAPRIKGEMNYEEILKLVLNE